MGSATSPLNVIASSTEMSDQPLTSSPTHKDAMLSWMQDLAPFGILTTDTALRIRSWNQWLVTHSGFAAETVLGRSLLEVFPDINQRRVGEYFKRALAGEISVLSTALHRYLLPLNNTVRGTSEHTMQQTARIAPLHFEEKILGTIIIIEDVSQREHQASVLRRQHAQEQLLSWALAHLLQSTDPLKDVTSLLPKVAAQLELEGYFNYLIAPDGQTVVLHASGGLTSAPEAGFAVLPVGRALCGLCADERRPVALNQVSTSEDTRAVAIRALGVKAYAAFPLLVGERLLGTLAFASFGKDVIAVGDVEFLSTISQCVAIALDRTLQHDTLRVAQRSLRDHAESLEMKVAERTGRLHETISQLESFSYSVAHDLRAPIRALKSYCDVLLEDYSNALPADGKDIVKKLFRASDRLDNLTRDLLKFSKVSMQAVELSVLDLSDLVAEVVLSTPGLRGDIVKIQPPLGKIWGQRTLVQQCLANLFDNSLKFAQAPRPPRIVVRTEVIGKDSPVLLSPTNAPFNPAVHSQSSFSLDTRNPLSSKTGKNHRIRVWIEDNGMGVAPELHQKIFGIFERGGGPDMPEGTGIGLAIVARAMQQMGGTCGVESAVGAGSRFWLEFSADSCPRR